MPSSPPDSSSSPPPSATPSPEKFLAPAELAPAPAARPAWPTNLGLFVLTVGSVFATWLAFKGDVSREAQLEAGEYTGALMAILLAHEFGHYIAARIHRVDSSLPYFIPLPVLSPFGTFGAVIRMRSVIPTRRALLDIGAAGPLAGMVLAVPLYAWGVAHSRVVALTPGGDYVQLGSSLLTRLLDLGFAPPIPEGHDIELSPAAYAGWAGMFVTMINLLPVAQLDGGHVAFALLGPRQNGVAQWVHRSMLAFFFVSLASFTAREFRAGFGFWHLGHHVDSALFWLGWFEVLAILGVLSGGRGSAPDRLGVRTRAVALIGLWVLAAVLRDSAPVLWWTWFAGLGVLIVMEARWGALRSSSGLLDHPATGVEPLRAGRAVVAVFTLLLFALLFMPTPFDF